LLLCGIAIGILMAVVPADLLTSGDRWWKGAAAGFAAGFKLTSAIFIACLLVTRRFRCASTAAGAFARTIAAGLAMLPAPPRQYWPGGLFPDTGRPGPVSHASNQSWPPRLRHLL
jgi:hypothetical protein